MAALAAAEYRYDPVNGGNTVRKLRRSYFHHRKIHTDETKAYAKTVADCNIENEMNQTIAGRSILVPIAFTLLEITAHREMFSEVKVVFGVYEF